MRIAQISPLHESVPPKLYGGTERVVHFLTEALVDLGHEVTLFASGDSTTRAELVPCAPDGAAAGTGCADPVAPHVAMMEQVFARADDFDVMHFHIDYLQLRPGAAAGGPARHDACTAGWTRRSCGRSSATFPDVPLISISDAQREPHPRAELAGTVYHGLPADLYDLYAGARALPGVRRPHLAREAASIARWRSRGGWACR